MQRDWDGRVAAFAGAPGTLRVLRWVALLSAGLMVVAFAVTALKRLHYPYALEWVEDGNLLETMRVMRHQPLYAAPTPEYVPYLYAPLFFYVAAAMTKVMGTGFAAMRAVATLSTLGIFATLYGLVAGEFAGAHRRQARRLAGGLTVGFFVCAYPITGGFFDLGRVDMLCLLLVMGALLAGRKGLPVLAAVLWVAAVQTKQGMLPVAVLALCFEWGMPRRIALGLGTFAVGMAGSIWWLNHASGGWYGWYAFGTARGFALLPRLLVMFWPLLVLAPYPVVSLLGLGGAVLTPPDWRGRAARFYAMTGVGLVLGTWYVASHDGASGNSSLPAYLWLTVVGGIGLGRLYERLVGADDAGWGRAGAALLVVAATVQLAMHTYTPSLYEPSKEERAGLGRVLCALKQVPGDVLVSTHPAYEVLAGHRAFANGEAARAAMMRGGVEARKLQEGYAALLASGTLAGVMLDVDTSRTPAPRLFPTDELMRNYPVQVQFGHLGDPQFFTPHPTMLYLPCTREGGMDAKRMFPDLVVDESGCLGGGGAY